MNSRIFSTLVALAVVNIAGAQMLPHDEAIRVGHLDNGLTYYIRHNDQTPGQADFYIAQRVGSILEEPDQRGLAHFLEHMAFNGSEHFPDGNDGPRSIRSWCERNGIKFGADLNASTAVERTLYNVSNAPIARNGVVDTCLLILKDWSNGLLLRDEEIEAERGVIREEWRTRRSSMAYQRILEDAMPTIYAGTKYADCLPIGSIDVINTFPHDALRRYYTKWYRPDLQALIVVGDVDVDTVEQKILSLFSSVSMPDNAAPRTFYAINDNEEIITYSKSDSEQPTLNMQLFIKRDAAKREDRSTRQAFVDDYLSRLGMFVLRQRLARLTNVANPPVVSCSARDGQFYIADAKDALSISMSLYLDRPHEGVSAVMEVVEKLRRYGLTESEFQHAKMQFNVNLEHRLDNIDKTSNREYVSKIVSHFCDNSHLMSIEQEAALEHELMDNVSMEDVNMALRDIICIDYSGRNQVLLMYGPSKQNGSDYQMPDMVDVQKWIVEAESRDYVNDVVNEPIDRKFMKSLPCKGSIVSRTDFGNGYTEYLLSNGVKVYARPSVLEPNRLTIKMFRAGGQSLYPQADVLSMRMLSRVIVQSGAADFDHFTLERKRAGKALRVTPFFTQEEEGIEGVCAASDFKTWLEVAYLYVTQPRSDKDIFNGIIRRQREMLQNRNVSPSVIFNDSLQEMLYSNPERVGALTLGNIDQVSHDRIMQIYRERFGNMAGMSLIVPGDIRTDDFEELICQYVASLPADNESFESDTVGSNLLAMNTGCRTSLFTYPQATPSALTEVTYHAPIPYNAFNDLRANVLAQIMRAVYTDTVREKQGGTYGVSVKSQGWRTPEDGFALTINFRCDPDKYGDLIAIVDEQLRLMAENGPMETALNNVKEYERKNYERAILTNGWWEYVCYHKIAHQTDLNESYLAHVDALTTDDIRDFCRIILSSGNRLQVTMK